MDKIIALATSSGGQGGTGIWTIVEIIGLWMMFSKAGEEGWKAIIPFYREYTLCNIVTGSGSYFFRALIGLLIPVAGWIYTIYCAYKIAEATALAYGKEPGWAWGYLFLGPIFYCITGFDSSVYYGPMGSGDTRTGGAREARTVDFDVIRNEPEVEEVTYRTTVSQSTADEGETVDFSFEEHIPE